LKPSLPLKKQVPKMVYGNPTSNDPIAGGPGPNRSADRQGQLTCFFFHPNPGTTLLNLNF
jgi:hypothetical protein